MRNQGNIHIDLATMQVISPADFEHYTLGYEQGYADGIDRGLALAEEQEQERWADMRTFIHHRAQQPSYIDLATRRGEPARAERQREILKERGVA